MFNPIFDAELARRMYDERLHEAALERRARKARATQPKKETHVLPNLGNALIALGQKLKTPSPTA